MIYDWKMELYRCLPVFLQEAALSLYASRLNRLYYGGDYEEWFEEYRKRKDWALTDLEAWQNDRLQFMIDSAARHVPYYRERWSSVDWKSVKSPADLPLLPRLEKRSIQQNEEAFIAEGLSVRTLWTDVTSGTTGTALRIYWPIKLLPRFWALIEVMVRNVGGVGQHIPRAMMGGRPIIRGDTSHPPYWRFNRRWQQLYLSSYHVSSSTANYYAEAIKKYRSQWITGYGSGIAALAEAALKQEVDLVPVRTAIVSGDTLLPGMRESIEKFFQCKCYDLYGQSEGVCQAMECPHGRMHVIPELGVIEILREDGSACAPGEVGEIVATGLLNDAMPLIRYRLGDYAAWATNQNCPCGNPRPVITNLEGRLDDYLVTGDGRKIGRLSTAIKRSPTIHSAQIVQDRSGHAYLLVQPANGYRSQHARAVLDDILERIGKFNIEIREVREIPRTPQGKTVLVVRLADRPEMEAIYEGILQN